MDNAGDQTNANFNQQVHTKGLMRRHHLSTRLSNNYELCLIFDTPEQRCWQIRETTNIGRHSSVGKVSAFRRSFVRIPQQSFFVQPHISYGCCFLNSHSFFYRICLQISNSLTKPINDPTLKITILGREQTEQTSYLPVSVVCPVFVSFLESSSYISASLDR